MRSTKPPPNTSRGNEYADADAYADLLRAEFGASADPRDVTCVRCGRHRYANHATWDARGKPVCLDAEDCKAAMSASQ